MSEQATVTTKASAEQADGATKDKPLQLEQLSVKERREPTIPELALLAAAMRRNDDRDLGDLARKAFELWEACTKEIKDRQERRRCFMAELDARLPKPKGFPMSLEEFFVLLLPKRRTAERESAYRHFLMDWRRIGLEKAGDLLAEHKQKPLDSWEFRERGLLFQEWIRVSLRCNRRLNGRKGGKDVTPDEIKAEKQRATEEIRKALSIIDSEWDNAVMATIRLFAL